MVEEPALTARIAGDDAVVVTVLDPPSLGELEARVIDVSSTRLRLLLRVPIPRDAYLVVKLKNYLLFGEVGQCCALSGANETGANATGACEVVVLIEESLCLVPFESGPATLLQMVAAEPVH